MNKNLVRYPQHLQQKNLFAWSSADELLVDHVLSLDEIDKKRILIINDQFGAISSNLSHLHIDVYVDSFLSSKSIEINSNDLIHSLNLLNKIDHSYDLVLIYLPKNNAFFEDILCHLTNILDQGTAIICTGMIKHMSRGHFKLIEKYIGDLTTSLAVKKARLIFSKFNRKKQDSIYPRIISVEGFPQPFTNYSNVFSSEKLDVGTRFFLDHIPSGIKGNILDLGCANGIVGIKAKLINSHAEVYFSDESMMAIMSAKENYNRYDFSTAGRFFWTHITDGLENSKFDLILCNPPFHQGTTVGISIALDMFRSAYSVLKKGGVLRIVANSHLGYNSHLKKIFGNLKLVNSNQKFVIYECVKN